MARATAEGQEEPFPPRRYFVLEGTLSIETRAPADRRELTVGDTFHIAPKTAHLISNRSEADTRFLLVQGVGPYDFLRVGG